ncbi:MAG: NAD(P)-dependent oxidoreductase [Candidatus Woesearchaeota archaeon]
MIITLLECEDWEKEFFKQRLHQHELHFVDEPIESGVPENTEVLVVFIYSPVTQKLLSSLPNVKLVCTRSTGFDHIDLVACASKGVVVKNVPFYGENTVAEHTFALLLAISRRLVEGVLRVRSGVFDPHGLEGFDLKSKTLGVVGTGHIGQHVIRMANGFEMDVVAFDPFPNKAVQRKLGFRYADLNELLATSDIVTLHCPYNEHTHHLLNQDNLSKIKKGAVIINTARGGLIHNEALLSALSDGRVGFAGLDVLEEEVSIREEVEVLSKRRKGVDVHSMLIDHVLINHPRVVVTPHNAFNSKEALQRILNTTADNILVSSDANVVKVK